MDPPFPLAPLAPGRLLGPYRLERPIDQGGMGVVFAARAAGGGREVVIKALRPEFADDADRRARFAREVRALGRVSHPNLLSLLDADPDAPIPWLAVEPIEGQVLAEYLREAEPSIKERVRLLADAASAVAAMHAAGIVHRDLKPSNILIGADGEPVVIDFGLARIDGEDFALTRRDQRVGTPRYMAPEQIDPRIGRIGPWTDVYQLGVVLYFLLAERPPNADRDTTEVYRRVRTGRFASPRRFRRDAPRALERIVRKAMARRPADRFESADELAAELGRWVRGEPLRIERPFWRRWFDRSGTRVDGPAADS